MQTVTKRMIKTLLFVLQAPVRSKSEDNCTVKENAMSMPHRIVSLEDAEVSIRKIIKKTI